MPTGFFIFGRLALKFMWKIKYTRITKTALKRKNKEEELTLPDIMYCLKVLVF